MIVEGDGRWQEKEWGRRRKRRKNSENYKGEREGKEEKEKEKLLNALKIW